MEVAFYAIPCWAALVKAGKGRRIMAEIEMVITGSGWWEIAVAQQALDPCITLRWEQPKRTCLRACVPPSSDRHRGCHRERSGRL